MSGDYLWDRSGTPDADVEHLERLLGALRGRPAPLAVPERRAAVRRKAWLRRTLPWAVAASVLLLVYGAWARLHAPVRDDWVVQVVAGAPMSSARQVAGGERVGPGDLLETNRVSAVRLTARDVGELEIGPGSRFRVIDSRPGHQRFALEHGRLDARVWAAPGQFVVQTPSATALDLGCSYTLVVDANGDGTLSVTSGWVGLEREGHEALVPEGASCAIYPGHGPGVPRFDDASPAFRRGLEVLDGVAAGDRASALKLVVADSRERDRLSLWHLLARLPRGEAADVYDRLAAIVPPPAAASRDRILARDGAALDAWWDALGLGRIQLFRTYQAR